MYSKYLFVFFSIVFVVFSSCRKEEVVNDIPDEIQAQQTVNDLKIDKYFDFSLIKNIDLQLSTIGNNGTVLKNVRIDIYNSNPSFEAQEIKKAKLIYSGVTDNNGQLSANIDVPKSLEDIYISPRFLGLETNIRFSANSSIVYTFGGVNQVNITKSIHNINQDNYLTIGGWNSQGLPDYLEPNSDVIDQGLLDDINTSLPENVSGGIPATHPEFLAGVETNLVLQENAEVWITFVHEGAGYRNALGYFTYQQDNPPTSVNDINNYTIAFPNASYVNSGGELESGDKVQLKYYDESLQAFVDEFPAGTVIGWFLVSNGWNGTNVGDGNYKYYSISEFNPESDASLKQHNVLLYDNQRNLVLIGFEDLNREQWCDNDFNDAVFYATATPSTAIVTDNMETIDSDSQDTDGDGINDNVDDYPNDASKAFNSSFPDNITFGTLAFEDLWPYKGDYDYNDLVVDYQFNLITNSSNFITELEAKFVVKAIGASYKNGFAFELPISPSLIAAVNGQNIEESYVTLSSNGTESGQTNAVIIVFDNAFNILTHPGGGTGINTVIGNTYVQPDTINILIKFNTALRSDMLGDPPYNPFIIIDLDRGKEVHLADKAPTDLADESLLGTGNDDSNSSTNRYYKTSNNLPWAINIPQSFDYPVEKASIIDAHLKFGNWAESSGGVYTDWYTDKAGYRKSQNIYTH